MLKFKKIRVPIYGSRLVFIDSDSPKEIFKKFGFFEDQPLVHAHCYDAATKDKKWHCIYIILNTKSSAGKISNGVIAHECLHAVNFIFMNKGLIYDLNNDEPATYLIQWLVDECHKFLGCK